MSNSTIPSGFAILAKTKLIKHGDCMAVPLKETHRDGTVETPEVYGYMFFDQTVDGKAEYTQWQIRVPKVLGEECFEVEVKGPKDVDTFFKARNLNGPTMSSWTLSVQVYRHSQVTGMVEELGTVKNLRQQAAAIKLAAKSVSDQFPQFETSRECLQKLAATVAKALQTIDEAAGSSNPENKESKDGSSESQD